LRSSRRALSTRLFLTVWLVYGLHFATNIVREHYPAFSLAERGTLRVDPYLGLHPDLFEIPRRGAFINNNPGASIFAALPYAVARPFVDWVVERAPAGASSADSEPEYNDPRPLRRKFFRTVRERGLDLRFGLAAAVIQALGIAPLGALAVVVLFGTFRREGAPEGQAALLSLLFAFATPIFFRSATLNHNLLVAHFALFAFAVLQRREGAELTPLRLLGSGVLAGLTVLCDFSGVVPLVALGLYALAALRAGGASVRRWGWMIAGGAVPIAGLLAYQAWAFGSPWLPAQHYMPATHLSVRGWNGFSWPSPELLLRNLFDPRYGLFAFGPLLLLALGSRWARPNWPAPAPPRRQTALVWGIAAGMLLFTSSNQYAHLQWNTGFRMLAVVVPFLFLPTARVLATLPRRWAAGLGALAVAHSWCLAMVRQDAIGSVTRVALEGLRLPWLTSLWRANPAYLPLLETTGPRAWPFFVLLAVTLWIVWRAAPPSPLTQSPATEGSREPGAASAPPR
jgi:hypothetical protein